MLHWFNQEVNQVIQGMSSHREQGLSSTEAKQRLLKVGENQLHAKRKLAPWQIFFGQFTDFMVLVLIAAAVVSGLLGEKADAITIITIVILNAILGFMQEYRAEQSLEALKELTAPSANVLRDGKIQRIVAKEVVPGDILLLESGDRVSADGRLVEAIDLEINEATLTGESEAVSKSTNVLSDAQPVLGDQLNMAFAGTAVTSGRGKAVVIATGMQTEIGKIAGMIEAAEDEETPLQIRLAQMGRWLVVLCLGICAVVGTVGILRGEPPRQMFLAAVSLAVAAIPEGLPAIVTIALALGVQKMIKRKAIIRKLPAVETLGCATVICSDKTGTLTLNEMKVTKVWDNLLEYDLDSSRPPIQPLTKSLKILLEAGVLCNNAQLEYKKTGKTLKAIIHGDPTEGAILMGAAAFHIENKMLQNSFVRKGEIPFSSERKRMSVWVNDFNQNRLMFVKGAADVILERCSKIQIGEKILPIDRIAQQRIKQRVDEWGALALRVLAFAYRPSVAEEKNQDPETELIFIGLMGMNDPPRPESRSAIQKTKRAGIISKMITGDYPRTAAAIAKQIGLLRPNGKIITGAELDRLSENELVNSVMDIDVFARVSPHHKLRIVKALKKNGAIVAMTGDGINDAPAVKEADIGIAMGMSGTDVTKEASAMVIADDNFATIVAAVEEGRTIYENIRKFIRYLLSCNMGEILTMFGGILLGLPIPLLPIQILWVNLVTDGLPAIALGMDPATPGIMSKPPRPPREGIFSRGLSLKIMFQGFMIGLATLTVFVVKLHQGNLVEARTAAFAALVFAQLSFVFQCRSEEHNLFRMNLFDNKFLIGAVFISSIMQVMVMVMPWFQHIFYTTALGLQDWVMIFAITLFATYISELVFQFRNLIRKHLAIFRWSTHRVNSLVEK